MKHRKNKLLEFNKGVQKKSLIIRNLLTSLVLYGKVTTSSKKAKILKATADNFFSKLMKINKKYEENDARRESIRLIKKELFTEEAGKKAMNELLPKYISNKNQSFTANYKMGFRKGDAGEKVMIKLL